MTNLRFYLDNLWRWKIGVPERDDIVATYDTYDQLRESEWDKPFEQFMRNRLVMGAIRYGKFGAKGKKRYDRVESMIQRLTKYRETGNKECLVDVANQCMLEFVQCYHPKAHFHAEDDKEHQKTI